MPHVSEPPATGARRFQWPGRDQIRRPRNAKPGDFHEKIDIDGGTTLAFSKRVNRFRKAVKIRNRNPKGEAPFGIGLFFSKPQPATSALLQSSMKIQNLIAVCSLFLAFNATRWSAQGQWVEWPLTNGGNGHLYRVIRTPGLITWEAAEAGAAAQGDHLATITSAEENAFVYSLISDPTNWNGEFGPVIGGYQPNGAAEPASGWVWITGEPWSYVNWGNTQPDNGNGIPESKLHFWGGFGGGPSPRWNDYPPYWPGFYSYVVERDGLGPVTAEIRVSRVAIGWFSLSNATYRVDYSSELTTNTWVPLTTNTMAGTGGRMETEDSVPFGAPRRFYRVLQNP